MQQWSFYILPKCTSFPFDIFTFFEDQIFHLKHIRLLYLSVFCFLCYKKVGRDYHHISHLTTFGLNLLKIGTSPHLRTWKKLFVKTLKYIICGWIEASCWIRVESFAILFKLFICSKTFGVNENDFRNMESLHQVKGIEVARKVVKTNI